jgi:hypothetical protein
LNECFPSFAERILPQDDSNAVKDNRGTRDIKNERSTAVNGDLSHYLTYAFNNPFLNMQLTFSTTVETGSNNRSLKPKNTY